MKTNSSHISSEKVNIARRLATRPNNSPTGETVSALPSSYTSNVFATPSVLLTKKCWLHQYNKTVRVVSTSFTEELIASMILFAKVL